MKEGRDVRTFGLATGYYSNLTATDGVVNANEKVISG